VGVQVIDHDRTCGFLSVRLNDLLAAKERSQDWFPLSKSKEGRVRMSAEWKPVLMSGSLNGGSGYTPSIGVLKFHMHKAVGVKNVEAALGGKSDPYVSLKVRGAQVDGSVVQNNNLNPVWEEILYAPVHSLKDTVVVEVMDYQNQGRDRSIGTVDVPVKDLAAEGRGTRAVPYTGTGKSRRHAKLALGRGAFYGEIEFDVEFLPATALNGVEFSGAGNEAARKAGDGGGDDDDGGDPDAEAEDEAEQELEKTAQQMSAPTLDVGAGGGVERKPSVQQQANGVDRKTSLTRRHVKNKASLASIASVKTDATHAGDGVDMTREEVLACRECPPPPSLTIINATTA
jgi:hypothetical protein